MKKRLGESRLLNSLSATRERIKKQGIFRTLPQVTGIDFASNDFLNLAADKRIAKASQSAIEKWGNSSSSSRLITGNTPLFTEAENNLARFNGTEKALLFSCGYMANLAVLSALTNKETVVFADKLCHASIIDGLQLGPAKFYRYAHNDMNHLNSLIKKHGVKRPCLIVTESLFSMNGDRAPLTEIVKIARRYRAAIMVDEAHAVGVFGKRLSGLGEELRQEITVTVGTLGKGAGVFGAYVACSKEVQEILVNLARPFIYTTALPPAVLGGINKTVKIIPACKKKAERLLKNANFFRETLQAEGLDTMDSDSHIVPVLIKDNRLATSLSAHLKKLGYIVAGIRPPTVPENQARLRIVIHAKHTKRLLQQLANCIIAFLGKPE